MPLLALAVPFLTPLLLAPHLLFYYDVTPKIAALLLGAACALLLAAQKMFNEGWDSLASYYGTPAPRAFLYAAAGSLAVTALTTALATNRDLALYGSNWRRMGAITDFAILTSAILIAIHISSSADRLPPLLRSISAAGTLCALYGIGQYFGVDPFLPASQYQVGEGIYQIVRPPSTLGHSDYFAAFLVWPIFTGLALFRTEKNPPWRLLGATSAATGIIAILLSGSRGALLALAIGLFTLVTLLRPNPRTIAAALAGAALIVGIFYISPAGTRLRARVHWIAEDTAGGARLQLWRDSLKMAAAKPFLGVGPENFPAEFPHHQSVELERAYPNFFNESPHNLLLDTLTNEGAFGLLALLTIITIPLFASRHPTPIRDALLPVFIAALVAHQFVVFTAANSFFFYLGAALLAGQNLRSIRVHSCSFVASLSFLTPAIFFTYVAFHLISADHQLSTIQSQLDTHHPREAADSYRAILSHPTYGLSADLYFSTRFAATAQASENFNDRLYYSQIAAGAATLATRNPEERQNAWYTLAILAAARRDPSAVELCLRNTIAAAPVWYKPHWTLARLLANQGRWEEAAVQARQALDLDGGKDPEVASTVAEILRSAPPHP